MIKKYNEFVKINEEKEFGSNTAAKNLGKNIKNLLGGLLSDVSDTLKQPIEDLNKKLKNKEKKLEKIKVSIDYFDKNRTQLETDIKDLENISEIRNRINDNIKTIYTSLTDISVKMDDNSFSIENVFKNENENVKKIFNYNSKKFDKNVEIFTKDLLLNIGKKYGLEENDLEKTTQTEKDESEKEKIDQATKTQESKIYEAISNDDLTKFKQDIMKWFDDRIYKNVKNTLNELSKTSKNNTTDDIDTKIKEIPDNITKNKDSVKQIINKLLSSDKQTIIDVRNTLGLDKTDTPL